jgi:hypothetical protein
MTIRTVINLPAATVSICNRIEQAELGYWIYCTALHKARDELHSFWDAQFVEALVSSQNSDSALCQRTELLRTAATQLPT